MKKSFYSSLIIAIVFFWVVPTVSAQEHSFLYLRKIKDALTDNFSLKSPAGQVLLNVFSGSNNQELIVKMMNIVPQSKINHYFTYDSDLSPASDLYFVKFTPYEAGNFSQMPEIQINYDPDGHYKEVYYYSWLNLRFEKIESIRDTINHTLTFALPNKKSVMFAVFNEPELVGSASWYVHPKYPNELVTASRDFAFDTRIKVTNLYNNREVVVTVKDYGPKKCEDWTAEEQEKMGPCQERILDLSKTAFLRLATTTGVGIISQVRVTPITE